MTISNLTTTQRIHPRVLVLAALAMGSICAGCSTMSTNGLPCDANWAAEQAEQIEGSEFDLPYVIEDRAQQQTSIKPTNDLNVTAIPSTAATNLIAAAQPVVIPRSELSDFADNQPRPLTEVMTVSDLAVGRGAGARIGGIHLGSPQTTATEHALRLQEENIALKAAKLSLLADNQRLKDHAQETEVLIDRITAAMAAAHLQLSKAEQANQNLRRNISELENQKKRQQLDTNRLLESIRDELDDVLMREIASKRN